MRSDSNLQHATGQGGEPPRREPRLEVAASRGAAPPQQEASASSAPVRLHAALVLRVLTGVQKGAQARMRHQRLLVGNLEAECDVVLDVGRPQQHACLVRASRDGWTVLSIAGDLWVGDTWISPQQTHAIVSGDVLTLGEVSFCIADTATIDWSLVHVPAQRQASGAIGGANDASVDSGFDDDRAAPGVHRARKGRIGSGLLIFWLLVGGLLLAGAGTYLVMGGLPGLPGFTKNVAAAPPAGQVLDKAKSVLAGLSWAKELSVQGDAINPRRVVLSGYLPERKQSAALDAALRQQGLEPEHRWTAIDEFKPDLARRLGSTDTEPMQVRYTGQGRFMVVDLSVNAVKLDMLIRRALQEVPAVRAIDLQLGDQVSEKGNLEAGIDAGSPVIVRYVRSSDAPGGVAVTGQEQLPPPQKLQRYDVRELRRGAMPSVVLDNGVRYFEGAVLPGGALLVKIHADHMVVQMGGDTRQIDIESGLPLAEKPVVPTRRTSGGRKS